MSEHCLSSASGPRAPCPCGAAFWFLENTQVFREMMNMKRLCTEMPPLMLAVSKSD